MFTPDDRKELIGIFQQLEPEIVECLQNEVLPSSITHNGEKVGITIEFRKLYPDGTLYAAEGGTTWSPKNEH